MGPTLTKSKNTKRQVALQPSERETTLDLIPLHKPLPPVNSRLIPDTKIHVQTTTTYKEVYGRKHLHSVYHEFTIRFSGDLMANYGASVFWLESIYLTFPDADNSYPPTEYFDGRPQLDISRIQTIKSIRAPFTFKLLCAPLTAYTVFGRINTLCGNSYDFTHSVKGHEFRTNAWEHCPIDRPKPVTKTFDIKAKRPELRGKKSVYVFEGTYLEDMFSANGVRLPVHFKIITAIGDPTKVLDAFIDGKAGATCTCAVGSHGTFKIGFKTDREACEGTWTGDVVTMGWTTDIHCFRAGTLAVHASTMESDHVLNVVRDLPEKMIGDLLNAIAKDIYREDNPAYIDWYQDETPASLYFNQIGLFDQSLQTTLSNILKRMILIHSKHAQWISKKDQSQPPRFKPEVLAEILFEFKDIPDINYIAPQIILQMNHWEVKSCSAFNQKRIQEKKFEKEQKYFYNKDRMIWLLVQQTHPILSKFPKEIVRFIARMLPQVSHGALVFGYQRLEESYGCGGCSVETFEILTFNPSAHTAERWLRSMKPPTKPDVFDFGIDGSEITLLNCGSYLIRKDVCRGMVLVPKNNPNCIYYQFTVEEKFNTIH